MFIWLFVYCNGNVKFGDVFSALRTHTKQTVPGVGPLLLTGAPDVGVKRAVILGIHGF
jgi:hypothetical protein